MVPTASAAGWVIGGATGAIAVLTVVATRRSGSGAGAAGGAVAGVRAGVVSGARVGAVVGGVRRRCRVGRDVVVAAPLTAG